VLVELEIPPEPVEPVSVEPSPPAEPLPKLLYFSDGRAKVGQSILMAYTGGDPNVKIPQVVARLAVNSDFMCDDFRTKLCEMLEKNETHGEEFEKLLTQKIKFLIGL
jgi:hypothetical protein